MVVARQQPAATTDHRRPRQRQGTPGGANATNPAAAPPGPAGQPSRVKTAVATAIRARWRRHQLRAVVCGTPARRALLRVPAPQATASIVGPMTSTPSRRLTNRNDGSNAWLARQALQRARRTHTLNVARQRTGRS
jgi:hypothetical protein